MMASHEQLVIRVQLAVPQKAVKIRVARSGCAAVMTSFLLFDTKQSG